jgi:cysteine-rich repeat protein
MRNAVAVVVVSVALVLSSTAHAQQMCGNTTVEAPELCDDGNLADGDGCDSNCTPTGCGNGVVTAGEECDDGNTVPGDCCSALCQSENLPPDCSGAVASTDELWPPNHKMASVAIIGVTDPDGDPVVVRATAVAQDEPLDASGDGATCPDAQGIGLDSVGLRSERSGQGDGRFYHIAFEAVDRCNAVCTGEVEVVVPHDRSPHKTAGDGGPLYDSTLGAPPCEGDECDPSDCVPDPGEVEECDGAPIPASVTTKLDEAKDALGAGKTGRGARLLRKAAKRAAKAARTGDLAEECSAALAAALDGGRRCAICSGAE